MALGGLFGVFGYTKSVIWGDIRIITMEKKDYRWAMLAGWFLILLGLLVNQWTVGYLRPIPRPITQIKNLAVIWFFELVCVAVGALFVARPGIMTVGNLTRIYRKASVVIVGALCVFIFLNLFIYAGTTLRAGSYVNPIAQKYGLTPYDLYPGMDRATVARILEETWSRGFVYDPLTLFREKPYAGSQYVNIDEHGFRHVKDQAPWPPEKDAFNIFVFGGSTTFGYGVSDDQTIASFLQEQLRAVYPEKKLAVYNFGQGYYYSTQERSLYEKLLTAGSVPNAAIFIDGLNDLNPDFAGDQPAFTARMKGLFEQSDNVIMAAWRGLPVVSMLGQYGLTKQSARDDKDVSTVQESLHRYLGNKRLIEAASDAFHVEPLFVWQPIPDYKYDQRHSVFGNESGEGRYLYQYGYSRMTDTLTSYAMGDDFLYLADMQENMKRSLYVDGVHYSGELSRDIAERIAAFMKQAIFEP